MNGILFFINIKSPTVFNWDPKLPAGCNLEKSNLLNFFLFKVAIEIETPSANCAIVLDVGTIDRPASLTSGISSLILDALYNNCLKFLMTRVDLDLALFKDDIWAH